MLANNGTSILTKVMVSKQIKHVHKMNKCAMCQNGFTRFYVRCCL